MQSSINEFLDFVATIPPEGETILFVKQVPVLEHGKQAMYMDGSPKYTWPPYKRIPKVRAGEALYINIASFVTERFIDGKPAATAANCDYVWVMVLDDVGTKSIAPPLKATPTWIIETSLENFQYGYVFTLEDAPTKQEFCALINAMAEAGYTDGGAKGAVRNVRVPGSVNLKPSREGFVARLVEFNPEVKYTPDQICKLFKVTPNEADTAMYRPVHLADDGNDEVLGWLSDQGLLLEAPNGSGWCGVVCPNHEQHSNDDTMGRYHPVNRSYCCLHEHCQHINSEKFLGWVCENGGPDAEQGIRSELIAPKIKEALAKITPTKDFPDIVEKIVEETTQRNEQIQDILDDKLAWFDRYVYVKIDEVYFDLVERTRVTFRGFDTIYAGIKCKEQGRPISASKWFNLHREEHGGKMVDRLSYCAGAPVIFQDDNHLCGNLWQDLRPAKQKTHLRADPWLDLGAHLIPNEEELNHILDVFACKLQYPERKINHAIGLFSAGIQGNGKDSFLEPFFQAVSGTSRRNLGTVNSGALSKWGYAYESEILMLSELYSDNYRERETLQNRLKIIIAAPPHHIEIETKGFKPYNIVNKLLVIATSNYDIPLKIEANDRRWYIIQSKAAQLSNKEADAYWSWLRNGGYHAVANYLYERDVSAFNPLENIGTNDAKEAMKLGSLSDCEAIVREAIEHRRGEFSRGVVGGLPKDIVKGLDLDGVKFHKSAVWSALRAMEWVDIGRCHSRQHQNKKPLWVSPDMVTLDRSALRNMVEEPIESAMLKLIK